MFRRCAARLRWTAPRMTVLDNGLKVVTYSEQSPASCVGVVSKVGCRYEGEGEKGCARLLEMMAYGVEPEGGVQTQTEVTNNREWIVFNISCARWEVPEAMGMLSKIALPRDLTSKRLQSAIDLAIADLDKLRIEPSKILFEHLHQAAWDRNTLGNPTVDFNNTFSDITPEILHKYVHSTVQPERLTVVGKGVEHEALIDYVEKTFTPVLEGWERIPLSEEVLKPSVYTGGVRTMENLTAPASFAKFEEKNNTHIGVMMEGVPLNHPDHTTMLVTQSLLGGGMSFSAGGPGKGILTKLYRCLCRYSWLDGIEAISASYSDSGIIGIYGQAEHHHNQKLLNLLCQNLATITEGISEPMVNMAKNKYLFQTFMSLDERANSVGEIGKYAAICNKVFCPEEVHQKVNEVTLERIDAFIRQRLEGEFVKCTYGNLEGFKDLEVKSLVKSFLK
eukprot:TRINITY_DN2344_c1_g1_i1.p1 TRINITY_DN2344_c1_g1~~TRINITY_DN2344_c1_g1_i1.p1  ORF type:complete len:448 (+),score=121.60 TRINITY_DN2344_c1_g1_i1:57-1400(+)